MMVRPPREQNSSSVFSMLLVVSASHAQVGSSNSITSGWSDSAIASEALWASPPESDDHERLKTELSSPQLEATSTGCCLCFAARCVRNRVTSSYSPCGVPNSVGRC
mmetsp:Transcript_26747/g.79016  ORF Transcript_26747/g.79016 Transcript_26747/m.79016 type:complete len:107 (-) Transcript_26747:1696-2016(-)